MTPDATDTRWLTYDELAAALAITPDSARRLVARKKWPRRGGNDGRARIGVPAERIPDSPPVSPPDALPATGTDDSPADRADDRGDVSLVVGVLTQHIERLEKDLEAVKAERDEERQRSAQLALQAAQVEALHKIIDTERQRSNQQLGDLRSERDRWATQAERLAIPVPVKRPGWWPFKRAV